MLSLRKLIAPIPRGSFSPYISTRLSSNSIPGGRKETVRHRMSSLLFIPSVITKSSLRPYAGLTIPIVNDVFALSIYIQTLTFFLKSLSTNDKIEAFIKFLKASATDIGIPTDMVYGGRLEDMSYKVATVTIKVCLEWQVGDVLVYSPLDVGPRRFKKVARARDTNGKCPTVLG